MRNDFATLRDDCFAKNRRKSLAGLGAPFYFLHSESLTEYALRRRPASVKPLHTVMSKSSSNSQVNGPDYMTLSRALERIVDDIPRLSCRPDVIIRPVLDRLDRTRRVACFDNLICGGLAHVRISP